MYTVKLFYFSCQDILGMYSGNSFTNCLCLKVDEFIDRNKLNKINLRT